MHNYRKSLLMLVFLILISTNILPLAYASTLIAAYGTFSHAAWSPDWGIKNFNYSFTYQGDAFSGYEIRTYYEAVENHDFYAYKTPSQVIWPPEVGNGNCLLYRVEMVDSSGNVDAYLTSAAFQNGNIRGYILPGGTYFYFIKKSSWWLQVFESDVYYVTAKTYFELESDQWFPSGPWIDSASTNTF